MISIKVSASASGSITGSVGPLSSYTHDKLSVGGYRSAKFSFVSNIAVATDWLTDGVGAEIVSSDVSGINVWEGVVNKVSVSMGGDKITVGPLLSVANRVSVAYTTPSDDGYDNSFSRETEWLDDLDSQRSYGILEELVSGGELRDYQADELAVASLKKSRSPKYSESVSTTDARQLVTISVDCIGYTRILEKQIYLYYGEPPDYDRNVQVSLDDKVKAILADSKYLSQTLAGTQLLIDGFDQLVYATEEDNNTSWSIIEDEITNLGLSESVLCGFFGNRQFRLTRVNTRDKYYRRLGSGTVQYQGEDIPPAQVSPGFMLTTSSLNKRIEYVVTSVSYNMSSNSISINEFENSLRAVLDGTMLGGRM